MKSQKQIDWREIEYFKREAIRWQLASRCDCPNESRKAAIVARKYLFFIINTCSGQVKPRIELNV